MLSTVRMVHGTKTNDKIYIYSPAIFFIKLELLFNIMYSTNGEMCSLLFVVEVTEKPLRLYTYYYL